MNSPCGEIRHTVAPFTGAWIETGGESKISVICGSLPSRERGLKQVGDFVGE